MQVWDDLPQVSIKRAPATQSAEAGLPDAGVACN